YRWYPALDLARIPFHAADGPWGARAPITAPEAPRTTRSVTVTSAAELSAEGIVAGTEITIGASFADQAVLLGDVIDVDIVVPPGVSTGSILVGRYTPESTTTRVRLRGPTPGVHSGGRVGSIGFMSSTTTDVIVDGLDMNGEDGRGGGLLWQFAFPVERAAIVNVRGHASGAASLGEGRDIVYAGNAIMSGARPREVNGYPEGWEHRAGSHLVVFRSDIRGTRYHRVRVHPDPSRAPQHLWVDGNVLVDPHEARILDSFDLEGMGRDFASVWATCNRVHAHSTCITPSFAATDASYARLTDNAIHGAFTLETMRDGAMRDGPMHDYTTGNTYGPWEEPPPWGGPGDPTTVPLPPVDASRFDASLADPFGPCPGPGG
ncbi:MAG: hypothetical protein IT379_04475, partial [Deltaproteobacteria bacterium]|nr:hypothetical protein [Deltaproteobacteria bacterium]